MIGRKKELNELDELYNSGRAELVAVYGRRRVGKTYLINECFSNDFVFKHTGLSTAEIKGAGMLAAQLNQFYISLREYGLENEKKPKDWQEAFFLLRKLLQQKDDGSRQVVFIDELPWLDTPRSGFLTGLESFWNGWGSARHNLMVIVCGSATSWMRDKLINNYGGLYGRVTYEIYLSQFNLYETEQYFKERGIEFSRYDIAESYMVVGGIPFYLGYFKRGLSLPQNIDEIFFKQHAKLKDEYDRLFNSIFFNPERIKAIVELLANRRLGYTRKEIAESLNIANNGQLSEDLSALIVSDFVIKYVPFGYSGKQEHYKLVDNFCLFHLRFLKKRKSTSQNYWEENLSSNSIVSWRGYAFEDVCFNHIEQIKSALSIAGVNVEASAWSPKGEDGADGMQIDMLLCRADNIVNLCEIKYYSNLFNTDKKTYMQMMSRKESLQIMLAPTKSVRNTLITTFGLKQNEYSNVFTNVITLDDLFEMD